MMQVQQWAHQTQEALYQVADRCTYTRAVAFTAVTRHHVFPIARTYSRPEILGCARQAGHRGCQGGSHCRRFAENLPGAPEGAQLRRTGRDHCGHGTGVDDRSH